MAIGLKHLAAQSNAQLQLQIKREPLKEPIVNARNGLPESIRIALVRAGAYQFNKQAILASPEFKSLTTGREGITYLSTATKAMLPRLIEEMKGALKTAGYIEISGLLEKGYVKIPRCIWHSKEARVSAVRALKEHLKKEAKDISFEDFTNNGLGGLIVHRYLGSPYKAVSEAFPELGLKQWEMIVTPMHFYESKKNRVNATRWLAKKLNKNPRDLVQEDFFGNRLAGLMDHYGDSPYEAVREAFPRSKIKPWEMLKAPNGFFNSKANRTEAACWLAKKMKKDLREITQQEFIKNRLGGLLDFHHGSPYEIFLEAGLVTASDEARMRKPGPTPRIAA